MRAAGQTLMTVDDYRRLPEDGPQYQLIGGELLMAPAPRRIHQEILLNLASILHVYLRANPLGKAFPAPFDVVLSDYDVVQPDICVYLKNRLNCLTDAGATGAPHFVVEILSPGSERLDRGPKVALYAKHGVEEYWLIEAEARCIEVYRFQDSLEKPVSTHGPLAKFESPLFPGLCFQSKEIFYS